MNKIININTKMDIEAKELDVNFLTYLIMTGSTSYECVDAILKHFKVQEVVLDNGFKLYRNKIEKIDVQFEEGGESDSIGLGLFLAISKSKQGAK